MNKIPELTQEQDISICENLDLENKNSIAELLNKQINPPTFKVWLENERRFLSETETFCISPFNEVIYFHDFPHAIAKPQNTIICRFIGLLDKNNKPIYENDIYTIGNGKYRIVCFINHSHTSHHGSMKLGITHFAGFGSRDYYPIHDQREEIFYSLVGDIKIIGSALENPNLEGLE